MSPCPSRCSAPIWSRMVRESTFDETWNAMRLGMLALISPVITSTEGRWVARTRWIPAARAFCASRAISSSTFLPVSIIMSASSSTTTTMYGSFASTGTSPSAPSGWNRGSRIGAPSSAAVRTLRL